MGHHLVLNVWELLKEQLMLEFIVECIRGWSLVSTEDPAAIDILSVKSDMHRNPVCVWTSLLLYSDCVWASL